MKIEKGIEMPDKKSTRGGPMVYPLKEMEIGDSIFLEGDKIPGSLYRCGQNYARRSGKGFQCRKMDGGVRLWRVR